MFKGMRREIGVPPRRKRFGVRTQQLQRGLHLAALPCVPAAVGARGCSGAVPQRPRGARSLCL